MQLTSLPCFKCLSDPQVGQVARNAVLSGRPRGPNSTLQKHCLRYGTFHQDQAESAQGSHNSVSGYVPVRFLLRLIAPVTALVTVSACGPQVPPQPPPPKVQAAATRVAEFTEGVDTVSTLEASNLVELAAQSGGRIEQLKIRQGDEVEAGELLLVLDQDEEKA